MQTKYYYIRDEDKAPMITVCLIEENGIISRGISVCSHKDNPNKKIGRGIAYSRALKAGLNSDYGADVGSLPCRWASLTLWTDYGFSYLYDYNVLLSKFESKLFAGVGQ